MAKRVKSVQGVRFERETIEYSVDAFLRGRGWKQTCETPGSLWLWERDIGGKLYVVEKETALRIEDSRRFYELAR